MGTALIVTGGSISRPFLEKHYNEHTYDYIIGVDSGCNVLFQAEILPDIIVGDFDSIDTSVLAYYRKLAIKELSFNAQKDFTDTELAIQHILESKDFISELMLLGATGSRIDHMLSTVFMLTGYLDRLNVSIEDEHHHIEVLSGPKEIDIYKESYDYFSLLAISDVVTGVSYENAKYPLNMADIHRYNSIGVSNEWLSEKVTLTFKAGICILISTKDTH